jgi:Tfp pilus assembly protein PilN
VSPLNLASRPFRNETLPTVLLTVAALAVLGLTLAQGLVIHRLRSVSASAQQREAAELEAETARLQAETRSLRVPKPSKDALAEWAAIKDLVDRRSFSWTGLFAQLEAVLPRDIRLQSITPRVRRGRLGLELEATARSTEAGLDFMRVLEAAEAFEDVYPPQVEPSAEGGRFRYSMTYHAVSPESPAASPAPGSTARSAPPASLP